MASAKLQNIRQKDKDIVSGFAKQAQLLFPDENAYYNIVELIQILIVVYYSATFDTEILNDDTEQEKFTSFLSENKKITPDSSFKLLYRSLRDGLNKKSFVERVYQKRNILLVIKVKDKDNECIIGGYTKTGWDNDEPAHKSSTYQYYSDKDAFVYCFKSANNEHPPFISNIRQTDDDFISHAICDTCDDLVSDPAFGAFGHSWIFWFTENGIYLKSHGGGGRYSNYEQFASGSSTKLHGGNSANLIQLEVFQIEMGSD